MSTDPRPMVDRLYEAFAADDLDGVVGLYDDDAVVARHDGAVRGLDAIRGFWERYLENHHPYVLDHIVAFAHHHDVVIWDAIITTDAGKLLTYHVATFGPEGRITRHVPLIRGYWGLGA